MDKILLYAKGRITGIFLVIIALLFTLSGWSQTVITDKNDYAPGEYVIITGTGWQPGERVDFTFVETPKPESCVNSHDNFAIADANGDISYDGFLIKINHLGVAFELTATGKSSGNTAIAYFTDAINTSITLVSPPSASQGTTIAITATILQSNGTNSGQPTPSGTSITFTLSGTTIGNATTNSSGVASINYIVNATVGSYSGSNGIKAIFDGTEFYNKTSSQKAFAVTASNCNSPSITTPPTAKTITYGDANPIFSVSATGDGLSYQWQYRTISTSTTWNSVGTNNNIYTVPSPDVSFSGREYRVLVSGCSPVQTVTSTAGVLTVNPKELTPAIVANDKPYDGNTSATLSSQTVSGMVNGETAVGLVVGAVSFNDKNVGTRTATASDLSLNGTAAGNYSLAVGATASDDAQITAVQLTPAIVANDKPYDGNTSATLSSQTVSGMVNGETAVGLVVGAVSFNDKNVGTRTATASDLSLNGTAAGNYSLAVGATASDDAQITAVQLTPAIVANDKPYDGNTSATLSSQTVSGMVNGETAVGLVVGAVSFNDKNVGTRTATASDLSLNGTAAGNYSLAVGATASDDAQITAVQLTPAIVANDKPYDGNTSATLSSQTVSGMVNGETAVGLVVGAVSFNDKNVGTRTATASDLSLNGTAAGNYSLAVGATASDDAQITAVQLTPAIVANDKPYDGNTSATLSSQTVSGMVNGETAVGLVVGAVSFNDKNVGTRTATASDLSLNGTAAGNYSLAVGATASDDAQITAVQLTPAIVANDKPYDGNTSATLSSQTVSGMVNGETAVGLVVGAVSFNDKNVGTRTATASDLSLNGTAAGNYSLAVGATASDDAQITAVQLTPAIVANDKPYDGNTSATLSSQTVSGMVNGETAVGLVVGAVSFNDKNVGTRTATASDLSLNGTAAGNYSLAVGATASDDAQITAVQLTPAIVANDKPYDGNTSATLSSQTVSGMVNGETAVGLVVGAVSFNDKNVGTRTATASDLSLNGTAAGNYSLAVGATASDDAQITAVQLTPAIVANDKPYDGNTSATLSSQTVSGMVNGETAVGLVVGAVSFNDKNVGTRTATASDLSLNGTAAGNYSLAAGATASDDAQITAKPLTITAPNLSKYCGQVDPTGNCSDCAFGLIGSESVTITYSVINGVVVPAIGQANTSGFDPANYTANPVNGILTVKLVTFDITDAQTPRIFNQSFTVKVIVKDGENKIADVNVKLFIGGIMYENPSASLGNYTFTIPGLPTGLYEVYSTAGGNCSKSETVFLPIYDPNGGFVTGGGWIESPAGASKLFPAAVGRANFGFNAKYKTGRNNANEVDGHTNFQFKAGDLHFSSILHYNLSLVVSGPKATYTGEGTINGAGSYEFRLIALDGDLLSSTTSDKFRIKIWTKGSPNDVIYDNEKDVSESIDASTAIKGGSIVIHKPKGKAQEIVTKGTPVIMEDLRPEILETLAASPNPVVSSSTVRFSVKEDAIVTLRLFDHSGRMIETLFQGNVKALENYDVDFQRRNLMSGIYIVKLTTAKGHSYEKRIIIN